MLQRKKSECQPGKFRSWCICLCGISMMVVWQSGCYQRRNIDFYPQAQPCQTFLDQIEYPDLCNESCADGDQFLSEPPMTVSTFNELEPWELTLDECVQMALAGSKAIQRLGGVVVSSPQSVTTLYDPALQESNPQQSVEAALSDFDAQFSTSFFFNHSERSFNNLFIGGGAASITSDSSVFLAELQKTAANGATFRMSSRTDYNRNNSPANLFPSAYDILNLVELRQPLARGYGTLYNRIAGTNAIPGQYNGVLINRLRSDVTLADFEAAVRDLVRDVEVNYWELYFAYRDLSTKTRAREAARSTWENRKLRLSGGIDRPDDEAQARQQYFNFDNQVVNALAGIENRQLGLLGAERNLRRLMGLPVSDGRIIRPVTEPVAVPIAFDWDDSQVQTLGRRVELRRQKWVIRQRELELIAARQINRLQFDVVGQYGFRGFGDDLFGSRDRPNGSAFDDLINGDLDDWQLGVELGGPIGLRQGHLAVRNAELGLNRERVLLNEQQRQLLHDLSTAIVEVDRGYVSLKANINNLIAIEEELILKQKRFEGGEDQIFFLLDAQLRWATTESAVHRSMADYNLALLDFAYTTGSLLSRYSIFLTEGPWCEDANVRARVKAARIKDLGPPLDYRGLDKLSYGPYDQTLPGPATQAVSSEELFNDTPNAPPEPPDNSEQESNSEENNTEDAENEQSSFSLENLPFKYVEQ